MPGQGRLPVDRSRRPTLRPGRRCRLPSDVRRSADAPPRSRRTRRRYASRPITTSCCSAPESPSPRQCAAVFIAAARACRGRPGRGVTTERPREDAERLICAFCRPRLPPASGGGACEALHAYHRALQPAVRVGTTALRNRCFPPTPQYSLPRLVGLQEAPGKARRLCAARHMSRPVSSGTPMPDSELRSLAAAGQAPQTRGSDRADRAAAQRPRSRRFVDAFSDYRLDLRKIDVYRPPRPRSTTFYNDYELDDPLKLAAVEETCPFVRELIAKTCWRAISSIRISPFSINAW